VAHISFTQNPGKSVRGSTIYEEKPVNFRFYRTQDKDIALFLPIKPAKCMARKIKMKRNMTTFLASCS